MVIKNITIVNVFMRKMTSLQMDQGTKHIAEASENNKQLFVVTWEVCWIKYSKVSCMLLTTRFEASRCLFAQIFSSSSSLLLKKPKTLVDTSCYHAVITTKFPMNRIAIGVPYGRVLGSTSMVERKV
jgi:hypothetical protein